MATSLSGNRASGTRHNLPAEVAGFVGRERELAEVDRLLRQTRLLTLTGSGGCGKTRLALHAAGKLVSAFPDGVWFVPLAAVSDSALLPRSIATALGLGSAGGRSALPALVRALAGRRLLLILDNCEHLIGAAARVVETILRSCPHVRVLTTSREPLRVPGEVILRVPSLELPPPDGLVPAEDLASVEAVALFLQRARARRPDFALTAANAPSVATICLRLEGMPLALELAAAQLGTLSPEAIAARLDDALRLLGGGNRTLPRQETLRAALDWSYDLLAEQERALFRRLAVFAGSFSLEAVERVCGGGGIDPVDVLPLLTSLGEKSLVETVAGAPDSRYRFLEPVRQYASLHLVKKGEMDRVQRRHARYNRDLAEEADAWLMSSERTVWLERLALDLDNIRAALSWSKAAGNDGDAEIGLRLAGSLLWFWHFRGEINEGFDWVETLLARAPKATPDTRARALYVSAELAWLLGYTALAGERIEECISLWRALGAKRGLAYALQSLPITVDNPAGEASVEESIRLFEEEGDAFGAALAMGAVDQFALIRDGDPGGRGRARLEEALARMRRFGDDWGAAQMLNMLGDLERSLGDDASAAARYEEALMLLRRVGMTGTIPSLLQNLGYLALRRGDARRAWRLFREGLALFRDQGDQRGLADCLDGLGAAMASLAQPERAARLFGAADRLRETVGAGVWPANLADYERGVTTARDDLGTQGFEAAWAEGRARPVEETISQALAEAPRDSGGGTGDEAGLTPREREVALLVAEGLTNRQIGRRLVITEGTARLHVKHILQKLGFTSRAQIARWAAEQGLTAQSR
jgi:predicted ATPase/DNA-binding CsgD family transcriptional regulator